MPRITVTGATGQFGNLVIENLLQRGVPPSEIRASVRDVSKAAHHQARGIEVRRGDFDDPEALKTAFADTERLLIISTDKIGQRIDQHRRAVAAAKAANVGRILYTSIVSSQGGGTPQSGGTPTSGGQGEVSSPITVDHRATEQAILATGVPYTFLRNSFYAEYMLMPVIQALDSGVFVSSAQEGQLGSVSVRDLAEGAAAALIGPAQGNVIYELTYPQPWDYQEAVDLVSRVSGRHLEYHPVEDEGLTQVMQQAGAPEMAIQMAVGTNKFIREGGLAKVTGDLWRLLGHPVTSLEALVTRLLQR